jgi:hypothetical protein
MTSDDSRRKNAQLRDRIEQVLEKHPELRDVNEEIALRQDLHVEVGTPFLERTQGKLQERAAAIIERRPELEGYFDG